MSQMTIERLHELFDDNPENDSLAWEGACHDCREEVSVVAVPRADGIHIQGGSVYEPQRNNFFLKCDRCFRKEPALTNYQDCEVYSRVVGYLRPVAQWNDAKQEEFKDRRVFDRSLSS
ncbi:MAG: anaerobic ribonucleoside-triphosphate reductase [Deltaproteobacteria bacterium]|nr:anaerobic ribonucleoside-triphosphate reductase [Deltaproteobacteria bacterium]